MVSNVVSIFDRQPVTTFMDKVESVDAGDPIIPTWFVTEDLIASWVGELVDIIELDHYGPELEGPRLKEFEDELKDMLRRYFLKD